MTMRSVRRAARLGLVLALGLLLVGPFAAQSGRAAAPLFSDGFDSGNLNAWTSVKSGGDGSAATESAVVHDGQFAAEFSESANSGSYAYARATFASPQTDLTVDGFFQVTQEGARGSSVPLLRLFDDAGARQLNLYRLNQSSNQIWVQHSGSYIKTSGTLALNAWAELTVHVITQGSNAGLLEISLNGTSIYTTTSAKLGANIATAQIGNEAQRQMGTLLADTLTISSTTTTDTTPPDTTITGGPSGTVAATDASFTFAATEPGSTFQCQLDSVGATSCVSPQNYSNLPGGAHTFSVVATDVAGNADSTPATQSWTISSASSSSSQFTDGFESGNFSAWTSVKTGGDGSATAQRNVVHDGTYAARFSESATSGSYAYARETFASPQTELTVDGYFQVQQEGASGSNVPLVRLFDDAGTREVNLYRLNQSNNQVWVQWGGSYIKTSGVLPLNTWAEVTLHVVTQGPNAGLLEVSLNGASIYRATSANLGASVATLQIGNDAQRQTMTLFADTISATFGSSSDTTPPDTTITGGPSGTVASSSASFSFTATEAATFTCQLDAGAPTACASPQSYSTLAGGSHTFSVQATDMAGNADPTPATRTWTVSTACDTALAEPTDSFPGTVQVADNFEGNDFSQWTKVAQEGDATATIQQQNVHTGNCALHIHETTLQWDSRANLSKVLPTGTNEAWADGWFDYLAQSSDSTWNMPSFRFFSNGKRVLDVSRQNVYGSFFVRYPNGSGGWTIDSTGKTLALNTWYHIQIHTIANGNNSTVEVWLNGVKVYTKITVTTGTPTFDTVLLGAEHQGQAGEIAADDVIIKSSAPPPTNVTFSDGFETGNFSNWTTTLTGGDGAATVQTAVARTGSYAAQFTQSAGSTSFAYARQTLVNAATDLTVSGDFDVTQEGAGGGTVPLWTLYDADGTNVVGVFRFNQRSNQLGVEFGGQNWSTTGTLPLNAWATVSLHVITNGASSTVEAWVNGTSVFQATTANLGYLGIKTLQIGNAASGSASITVVDNVSASLGTAGPQPDPQYKLLIADYLNRRLLITDFNGGVLWEYDNPTGGQDSGDGPLGVRWEPGNRILATFGTGEVGLIDVASKTWVWKVKGFNGDWFQSPYDAELLPDGNLAVALRYNNGGRVSVYNLATGKEVWRYLLSNAHTVRYLTAAQSYNSTQPTLLIGGWGATLEVVYKPSDTLNGAGQTVTWQTTTEYTHDAFPVENHLLITIEGYYIQKINQQGTRIWRKNTPDEERRMAINPNAGGGYVMTSGEGDRIEFRDLGGNVLRQWTVLSDGTKLDFPYGIQVIQYP